MTGWSVGYKVLESREPTAAEKAKGAKRVIVKWAIIECSPVEVPAGLATGPVSVTCNS
jgi:hypothetical protein